MENFINSALGAVNITGASKYPAHARPLLLQKNNDSKQGGQWELRDVKDGFLHKKFVSEM